MMLEKNVKNSWPDEIRNDEVFRRMNTQKSTQYTLKLRRVWIEHLIKNSPWITTIVKGKIKGKPGKRRPKTPFMKQVMDDTGIRMYMELHDETGINRLYDLKYIYTYIHVYVQKSVNIRGPVCLVFYEIAAHVPIIKR